jgi:glutathione peroxidase
MVQRKRYSRLKRMMVILLLLVITFVGYVAFVTRNSTNMNVRQKISKAMYPLLMGVTKLFGKNSKTMNNEQGVTAPKSVYDLTVTLNNGDTLALSSLRGKKVLLVNTASDCGYTNQYDDLQKLYEQYKDKLVIIGFPANDFHEQEKGSDEEIAQFCKVNFGVSFPLAKKSVVIKSPEQNPIFGWLTHKALNGWNEQAPSWNFSKYLLNERGVLTHYFDPSVSPTSQVVTTAITK